MGRDCPVPLNRCTGNFVYSDDKGTTTLISPFYLKTATIDCIPGIVAVIAYPDARFFQEMNIRIPAQRTHNSGIFFFITILIIHNAPEREMCRFFNNQ
jgi:hypothetical protein